MKRFSIVVALIAAVAVPIAVAEAAPMTAADFAADCADDGQIVVTGRQRYVGGDAVMTAHCNVTIGADSTLVLNDVILHGPSLVVSGSAPNAKVRLVTTKLYFTEVLELTAGCCAGDETVPENDGSIVLRLSGLYAGTIYINASFDWPNGRVVLVGTKLESTSAAGTVTIRASDLAGTDGLIRMIGSRITSRTSPTLATGANGRTVVRQSVFDLAPGVVPTITTGPGGVCVTASNIPAVSCS